MDQGGLIGVASSGGDPAQEHGMVGSSCECLGNGLALQPGGRFCQGDYATWGALDGQTGEWILTRGGWLPKSS